MFRLLSAAALLFSATLVAADTTRIGLGAIVTPQYEGSSDYRVIAAPNFAFDLGPVNVRSSGPGIEADVFASRTFDGGPILRWDGGRDPAKIDNAAVSALPQIDGALMVGGFAQLNFPVSEGVFVSPRLDVLQGLDGGHEGLIAEASVGVTRRTDDWTFGGRLGFTYADDSYMSTVFGVGAASPSGLAAFSASGGVKDIGVSVFANYQLNEDWALTGIAGVKQLVGDAADSPITAVTGNATQGFVGIGVSYTFN